MISSDIVYQKARREESKMDKRKDISLDEIKGKLDERHFISQTNEIKMSQSSVNNQENEALAAITPSQMNDKMQTHLNLGHSTNYSSNSYQSELEKDLLSQLDSAAITAGVLASKGNELKEENVISQPKNIEISQSSLNNQENQALAAISPSQMNGKMKTHLKLDQSKKYSSKSYQSELETDLLSQLDSVAISVGVSASKKNSPVSNFSQSGLDNAMNLSHESLEVRHVKEPSKVYKNAKSPKGAEKDTATEVRRKLSNGSTSRRHSTTSRESSRNARVSKFKNARGNLGPQETSSTSSAKPPPLPQEESKENEPHVETVSSNFTPTSGPNSRLSTRGSIGGTHIDVNKLRKERLSKHLSSAAYIKKRSDDVFSLDAVMGGIGGTELIDKRDLKPQE